MNRRELLKSLSLLACTGATKMSFKATAKTAPMTPANYKSLFAKALANDPKLIGYTGVEHNLGSGPIKFEGKFPSELNGRFFRNGPARLERGQIRYQHLFEGDGMIQEFKLQNGHLEHRGEFVATPKFSQEQQADAFLYSGPDTRLKNSRAITKADDINVANTSILPIGSDLWALWEAGSPSKVDGKSLQFESFVNLGGSASEKQTLKGMPFSAHPKIMANGEIWNFGYSPTGHIVIYHLDKNGKLKRFNVIKTDYVGGMKHDFLVTQNHVLLMLPSISLKGGGYDGVFSRMAYDPSLAFVVLVVDKNTLTVSRRYELDPAFAFHFGNAWEDSQGHIHFDAALYPNLDVLFKLSDLMAGDVPAEETNANPAMITLYKDGRSKTEVFPVATEFPRVVQQKTGMRNRHLYFISCKSDGVWHDTVCQLNQDSGQVSQYRYGDDYIVEEHVPISPDGDENKTYLMGTALHVPSKRTCLNVFDANALANGPIARAWLPYYLPLGFHGQYVPS